MPMCCRRACAAHVHRPAESFRRQSRGTVFGKSTAVPASTETELWQTPQGSTQFNTFFKGRKKRETNLKYKKCCIYFAGGPLWFLHILLLCVLVQIIGKRQKVQNSKVLRLTWWPTLALVQGEDVVFCKSYCLCFELYFHAVIKANWDISLLLSRNKTVG